MSLSKNEAASWVAQASTSAAGMRIVLAIVGLHDGALSEKRQGRRLGLILGPTAALREHPGRRRDSRVCRLKARSWLPPIGGETAFCRDR
ncbi:MAG: hypothetical protein WCF85_18475, partial [Rhodospirillaceae bacterium]